MFPTIFATMTNHKWSFFYPTPKLHRFAVGVLSSVGLIMVNAEKNAGIEFARNTKKIFKGGASEKFKNLPQPTNLIHA